MRLTKNVCSHYLIADSTSILDSLHRCPSGIEPVLEEVRRLLEGMATEVKRVEREKVVWKERLKKKDSNVASYEGGGGVQQKVFAEEDEEEEEEQHDQANPGGWNDDFDGTPDFNQPQTYNNQTPHPPNPPQTTPTPQNPPPITPTTPESLNQCNDDFGDEPDFERTEEIVQQQVEIKEKTPERKRDKIKKVLSVKRLFRKKK